MRVMGGLGSNMLCVVCIRYTLGRAQTYMYLASVACKRYTLGRTLSSRHVPLQPLSPSLNIFLFFFSSCLSHVLLTCTCQCQSQGAVRLSSEGGQGDEGQGRSWSVGGGVASLTMPLKTNSNDFGVFWNYLADSNSIVVVANIF